MNSPDEPVDWEFRIENPPDVTPMKATVAPRPDLIRVGEASYVSADVVDSVDTYEHPAMGWCTRTRAGDAEFLWAVQNDMVRADLRSREITGQVNSARQSTRHAAKA